MHSHYIYIRRALLVGTCCLVAAACGGGGGGGAQWTYAPLPSVTPAASGGASGSPGGSPGASGDVPSGSPAGSPGGSPSGSPSGSASASGSPNGSASASGSPNGSASASGLPSGSASASGSPAGSPGVPPSSSAGSSGAGQVIELSETSALEIVQDGQPVDQLSVMDGATITFRISNDAGFEHNFYIGPPDALAANQTSGLMGVPTSTEGVQEFQYTVTPETASLEFACTIPGHYPLMHGTFVLQ